MLPDIHAKPHQYIYILNLQNLLALPQAVLQNIDIVFEVSDSSGIIIGETNSIEVSFKFGSAPNGGEYLYPSSVVTNALEKPPYH